MRLLFIFSLFLISFSSFSQSKGIFVTNEELLKFAQNNVEKQKYYNLSLNLTAQRDSLENMNSILELNLQLKDSIINQKNVVINNTEKTSRLIEQESNSKDIAIEELRVENKKQKRKLNFWRIFTPTTVTIVSIIPILIK